MNGDDDAGGTTHGGGAADPMPVPPTRPGAAECCESACERCVFDVYADELDAYRQALARWHARHPAAASRNGGDR